MSYGVGLPVVSVTRVRRLLVTNARRRAGLRRPAVCASRSTPRPASTPGADPAGARRRSRARAAAACTPTGPVQGLTGPGWHAARRAALGSRRHPEHYARDRVRHQGAGRR